jgi:CDP-diglyceride synthetase
LFLDLILIFALFSIFYLAEKSLWLLLWVIILVICSDVGGYVFGKIFKWKKLTKISPKKTVSGVLGSFLFALLSVFIIQLIIEILYPSSYLLKDNFLKPEFFFLAIVFSLVSQAGDLTISYFKRLEKIKDVGKILPGHGGIFDRIDGLIFVVIVTLVFYKLQFIPL